MSYLRAGKFQVQLQPPVIRQVVPSMLLLLLLLLFHHQLLQLLVLVQQQVGRANQSFFSLCFLFFREGDTFITRSNDKYLKEI